MEKFAIDLDKVLDDFELDEDENQDSRFGHLEIDCSTDPVVNELPPGTSHAETKTVNRTDVNPSPTYLNPSSYKLNLASTDASDPSLDCSVPGVRSPPDGQNDEQSNPVAHHSQYGATGLYHHTLPSAQLTNNGMWSVHSPLVSYGNSSHYPGQGVSDSVRQEAIGASPTEPQNNFPNAGEGSDEDIPAVREVLGGAVDILENSEDARNVIEPPEQLIDVIPQPPDVPGLEPNVPQQPVDLLDQPNNQQIDDQRPQDQPIDVINCRPVDVIVGAQQSVDVIPDVDGTIRHPDVIDVSQHNEVAEEQIVEEVAPQDQPENDEVVGENIEPRLLPDLMAGNNDAEFPEPAIVTENVLACGGNEPALVQESQMANRIPEVVNVHQSCESGNIKYENPPVSQDSPDEVHGHGGVDLLDESVGRQGVSQENSNDNPSPAPVPIAFDPNVAVNDLDLEAELAELEEEQADLQGAYAVHQNSRNNPESDGQESLAVNTEENSCVSPNETVPNEGDQIAASTENCSNKLDNLPNISAKVCASNENQREQSDASEDGAASIDNPVNENVTPEPEDSQSAATPEGEVPYDAENSNDGEVATDEEASVPPVRQTPGRLVTAVYGENEDYRSSRHRSDSSLPTLMVGNVAPFWVPDNDAPLCQECAMKFTVMRRRHHCRACGRVLCAQCCKDKAALAYMHFKEARVCGTCRAILDSAEDSSSDYDSSQGAVGGAVGGTPGRSPDPNNPMEYCSRIPPHQQTGHGTGGASSLPSVVVPIGVLKREDAVSGAGGSKQVIFSDGIRPGGDLTESGNVAAQPHRTRSGRVAKLMPGAGGKKVSAKGEVCLLPPGGGLPPILLQDGTSDYVSSEGNPEEQRRLVEQIVGEGPPVLFALHKNLTVVVKKVKLDCCVGMTVWSLATRGLCGVGQEELVLLLEALEEEELPPSGVFAYFYSVYQQANKGNLVSELGHTILTEPEGFLGSKDHGGFIYMRPTFQCLQNLPLPKPPYLFTLLIHKWETPWAKVFPLRLLLRLGAEFRYYPCPLVSARNRKPVFSEIGHTIMNLLVDFRNYSYTIPGVQGLIIHMEDKRTTIYIPRNRYNQVSTALSNSNEHVLALAANFSARADSHLVTIENDDGQYSTQAINIHNRPRKVTGASFIVFNGALKSNCGLTAKSSIVEDGLMVQITNDVMTLLREALKSMRDFTISCGVKDEAPQELVFIKWTKDDSNFNVGVNSPVDNKALDGVPSVKIHSATDYVSSDFLIRWTEVFIIQGESTSCAAGDVNLSRIWEGLARGFCIAMTSHLAQLHAENSHHLALRATIHHQDVGYEAGSGGVTLCPEYLNSLDSELVPVIHRAAANVTHEAVVLELFFHILQT